MEDNYIEIDTGLYGGQRFLSKGHDPYEMEIVSCCNTENCPLFKNKQCIMCSRSARTGNVKCPYGKVDKWKGTSYRSKSYYDMKHKAEAAPTYKSEIKDAYPTYVVIGEYTLLNLKYVGFFKNTEKETYRVGQSWYSSWGNEKWLGEEVCFKTEEVTADMIQQILSATPRAFFGNGIITDFTTVFIPKFKADILKYSPKLAEELSITRESINYIGRKARLVTLTPPFDFTIKTATKSVAARYNEDKTVTCKDSKIIDSMYTSNAFIGFMGTIEEMEVKFIPDNRVIIEIANNSWVNEGTIFER